MRRQVLPAVPCSLALILGSLSGRHAIWCPPGLLVLLLAMSLALRSGLGRTSAFLAIGLLAGLSSRVPHLELDLSRPVELGVSTRGQWRDGALGSWSSGRTQWIRQGRRIQSWTTDLNVLLSPGVSPPESSLLRLRGYLRRSSPVANGTGSDYGLWALRIKSSAFLIEQSSSPTLLERGSMQLGRKIRGRVVQRLRKSESVATGGASLIRVLLLGDSNALPSAVKRGLRAAGLAHLVALSGLHIGLLIGIGLVCTAPFGMKVKFVVAVSLALIYVWLAGARPSLIRALLMALALMSSWFLRRVPQPVNVLFWAAGGMVALQPALVEDLGFQLTMVATGAILMVSPQIETRFAWVPKVIRSPLSVSFAAHLAVGPWSWSQFCIATPLSPFWNLLAVPWATVSLFLAFIWFISVWTVPGVGDALLVILDIVASPIEVLASSSPENLGSVPIRVSGLVGLMWAVGLVAAFAYLGWIRIGGIALLLVALGWSCNPVPRSPQLVVLDVGQGEAILIRDGPDALLVDGGGWLRRDIAGRVLVPALASLGVHRLNGMILSHPDSDHCEGLLGLISYMPVDDLYLAAGWEGARCVDDLLGSFSVESHPLWRGETLALGRWSLRVLHPKPGKRAGRNDRSMVLLAETSGQRILLTGDLEAGGEREILRSEGDWLDEIDILKVAHHGSSTSTTEALLERTQPRLALISCGRGNRYGHPSPEVLERLGDHRIRILRTDLLGMMELSFGPGLATHLRFPGQPRD